MKKYVLSVLIGSLACSSIVYTPVKASETTADSLLGLEETSSLLETQEDEVDTGSEYLEEKENEEEQENGVIENTDKESIVDVLEEDKEEIEENGEIKEVDKEEVKEIEFQLEEKATNQDISYFALYHQSSDYGISKRSVMPFDSILNFKAHIKNTVHILSSKLYIDDIYVGDGVLSDSGTYVEFNVKLWEVEGLQVGEHTLRFDYETDTGSYSLEARNIEVKPIIIGKKSNRIELEYFGKKPLELSLKAEELDIFEHTYDYRSTATISEDTQSDVLQPAPAEAFDGVIPDDLEFNCEIELDSYDVGYTAITDKHIKNAEIKGTRAYQFKFISKGDYFYDNFGLRVRINPKPITAVEDTFKVIPRDFDGTNYAIIAEGEQFTGIVEGETLVRDVDYKLYPSYQGSATSTPIEGGKDKPVMVGIDMLNKNYKLTKNTIYVKGDINKIPIESFVETGVYNTNPVGSVTTNSLYFSEDIWVAVSKNGRSSLSDSIDYKEWQILVDDKPVNMKNGYITDAVKLNYTCYGDLTNLPELTEGTHNVKVAYGGDESVTEGIIDLGDIELKALNTYVYNPPIDSTTFEFNGGLNFYNIPVEVAIGFEPNIGMTNSSSILRDVKAYADVELVEPYTNAVQGGINTRNGNLKITNVRFEGKYKNFFKFEGESQQSTIVITINPKKITSITATVDSKVYDGNTDVVNPQLHFEGLVEGFELVEGRDYTITQAYYDTPEVGTGKNVKVAWSINPDSKIAKCYDFSQTSSGYYYTTINTTGDILKADSEIVNENITNIENEPTTSFKVNETIRIKGTPIKAVKSSDTDYNKVEVLFNDVVVATTECEQDNNFEIDIPIEDSSLSVGEYSVKVKWYGNDTLNGTEEDYGSVKILPLEVKAEINKDVVYNGTNIFEDLEVDTVKDKDTGGLLDIGIKGNVVADGKNVGVHKVIDITAPTITGTESEKYTIRQDDLTGTLNIIQKEIKPSNANVHIQNNKVVIKDIEFDGLIAGESLTADKDYSYTYEFKDSSKKEIIIKIELKPTEVSNNYKLVDNTLEVSVTVTNKPHRPSKPQTEEEDTTKEESITKEEENIPKEQEDTEDLNKENIYKDMTNHWAKDTVEEMTHLGIVTGYPDGTFRPNEPITRADAGIILDKTLKHLGYDYNVYPDYPLYNDINENQYFYEQVQSLSVPNVMMLEGYLDNSFRPLNNISREESFVIVSKFLERYCNISDTSTPKTFKDIDKIALWSLPYFNSLNKYNILTGYLNNEIKPQDYITRAEYVTMIHKVITQSIGNQ